LNNIFLDSSDRGSITHFKETEIPFFALEETHLSPPTTTTTSSADGKLATPTRTTRSRSRVVEVVKSPSPIIEKQLIAASYETLPLRKVEYLPSAAPKPSSPSARTTELEQLDEDNDELDLIGPSTSYFHREKLSPLRITAIPSTNGNHELMSTREVLEQEPRHTASISEPSFKVAPVSPAMESASIEEEQEERAGILKGIEGTKERTTPQHPNELSEKASEVDEGMEVDEETEVAQGDNMEPASDEEMDVDKETKTDIRNSLPIRTPNELLPSPIEDNFEAGVSGTATQRPVLDTAEELLDKVSSLERKEIQSDIRSNTGEPGTPVTDVLKPPKYTPIHFPLPPSIQEVILIPAPTTNDEETAFNLDFELELTLSSVPTNVENRQRYDLKYTLPPLSVLPTDFTRKVKPRRKKDGKREKDDAVPMGLARWGATIMANPLWKRVAKATKCLNTREWGVRDGLIMDYGYNLLKV
jgi:chromatin modification-related protein VID21